MNRLWFLFLLATPSFAIVRQVGPGKPYATPCAAVAAAVDGDTIEIDPLGNYSGDVCAWTTNNLTLRGVGGRAKIDAAGNSSQGKAIWVIGGSNTVVENIEFTNAHVIDRNGAGIRQEGRNLTVRNCYFHHNDEGILSGGDLSSEILIEFSEFAYNGYGDGYSHNLYINHVAKLTFRFNYSHHANVGHLLKSRAAQNYILYNRLSDESTGTASYEVDLPNGGTSYIVGNLIEQGPQTGNSTIVAYREEGAYPDNPGTDLYVVNNTIVNDRPAGAVFIYDAAPQAAVIRNNVLAGPGTVTNQSNALLISNLTGVDPQLVDAASYDYHLRMGSPAIDAGTDPGTGFTPLYQYVHPACGQTRVTQGTIDIGAYEFGGAGASLPCSGAQVVTATLASLRLNATSVKGPATVTGTVTLTQAAPQGGVIVALASSASGTASVPAAVTVPEGSSSADFEVSAQRVAVTTMAVISATYAGVTKQAALEVRRFRGR